MIPEVSTPAKRSFLFETSMNYEVTAIIEHPSPMHAVAEELFIRNIIDRHGLLIRTLRRGHQILIFTPEYEQPTETTRTH